MLVYCVPLRKTQIKNDSPLIWISFTDSIQRGNTKFLFIGNLPEGPQNGTILFFFSLVFPDLCRILSNPFMIFVVDVSQSSLPRKPIGKPNSSKSVISVITIKHKMKKNGIFKIFKKFLNMNVLWGLWQFLHITYQRAISLQSLISLFEVCVIDSDEMS